MTLPIHPFSDEETLERLQKDTIVLMMSQPFFAYLLVRTKKVIDRRIPVAAVSVESGVIHLHINPEGYLQLSLPERQFVLLHELLHIVLHHLTRKGNRKHGLWNAAADLAIHQLITSPSVRMPEGALQVDSWHASHGFILPRGKTAEQYYDLLLERIGDQDVPESFRNSPFAPNRGNPNDTNPDGAPARSQNRQPSRGADKSSSPSLSDLHPTWDTSAEAPHDVTEAVIRQLLQETVNDAEGNLPGFLKDTLSELTPSHLNWKRPLRNFVARQRATQKNATWKRQNRRFGNDVMGRKQSRNLFLAVAFDTSGSVSSATLSSFFAELHRIHQTGATIVVIECDAAVQAVYRYTPRVTPTFKGRGGTDFRPVFELIRNGGHRLLHRRPDAVLFFTDGRGKAPVAAPVPTLWCLSPGGTQPKSEEGGTITWGSYLQLP